MFPSVQISDDAPIPGVFGAIKRLSDGTTRSVIFCNPKHYARHDHATVSAMWDVIAADLWAFHENGDGERMAEIIHLADYSKALREHVEERLAVGYEHDAIQRSREARAEAAALREESRLRRGE